MIAPVPKLGDVRRDVAILPALQEFLDKALAKSPEGRFADAGQMLEALNALPRPPLRKVSTVPAPLMAAPANVAPAAAQPPPPVKASSGPSERVQLIAALVTGVVTALALAYALLH
jgi:hypothetical protein